MGGSLPQPPQGPGRKITKCDWSTDVLWTATTEHFTECLIKRCASLLLSGDADGADVGVPEDRLYLDDLAGAWRVDHEAIAEVEADVADVGKEEH